MTGYRWGLKKGMYDSRRLSTALCFPLRASLLTTTKEKRKCSISRSAHFLLEFYKKTGKHPGNRLKVSVSAFRVVYKAEIINFDRDLLIAGQIKKVYGNLSRQRTQFELHPLNSLVNTQQPPSS
jgi:hypothetical protein